MPIFKALRALFLDALFPVSEAERELLSYAPDPARACRFLPRASRAPIPEACSLYAYKDERVRRLVWSLKYKKSGHAAAIAGHALFQVLMSFSTALPEALRPIVVVPMPITARRRRERGFNQCELIADEIGRLDSDKRLTIVPGLLVRTRHQSRQTLKGRADRLQSADGLFKVDQNEAARLAAREPHIKEGMIVVIDDVVTTGATMSDAVHTLRRAGFSNSWGLSLTH